MDRIINVQITGCTVKKDSKNAGVQGEANATTLRITFSPEWEALSKKILWLDAGGGNPVEKILTTETDGAFETTIPGEPLTKSGQCCFTIQGVKDSIVAMAVTEHLDVLPNDSYGMKAGNAADPTPSVADQLTGDVAALAKTVAALGKAMVNPIDKTADMTSPVGRDEDGKLWTAPGGATSVTADAIEKALGYTPADKKTIPTTLPSPHALTFTGAVTGNYDGSQDVSVEIPSGGGGEKSNTFVSNIEIEEAVSQIVVTLPVSLSKVLELNIHGCVPEQNATVTLFVHHGGNNYIGFGTLVAGKKNGFNMHYLKTDSTFMVIGTSTATDYYENAHPVTPTRPILVADTPTIEIATKESGTTFPSGTKLSIWGTAV